MKPSGLLWQTPSRLDRALSFMLGRRSEPHACVSADAAIPLEAFLSLEKKPDEVPLIRLGKADAYTHDFDGKATSHADLKKIARNELRRLAPLAEADEIVLVRQEAGRPGGLEFLHLRNDLIDRLQEKSRTLGLADLQLIAPGTDNAWTPPAQHLDQKLEARFLIVSLICFIASLFALLAGVDTWLENSVKASLIQERELRARLLERDTMERETGALGRIAAMQPDLLSPAGRMSALAELTQNTPPNAWWTSVDFDGTSIRISGASRNAAETLTSLVQAYPDYPVRFAQPVSTRPDRTEAFVITIETGTK